MSHAATQPQQTGCPPRLPRSPHPENPLPPLPSPRLRHHDRHPRNLPRRPPRRRRLSLPSPPPPGRIRLPLRQMDHQRHRPPRPHLRTNRRRQAATPPRRIPLASNHRRNHPSPKGGLTKMSLWTRITNALRPTGLDRDLDEELQSHIEEAIANGRDPQEAGRAFGSQLRHREQSRDAKLLPWLDSLRADAVFGLRQLRKSKITSAAAILSLALGMGLAVAGFRLIDALLWRPL